MLFSSALRSTVAVLALSLGLSACGGQESAPAKNDASAPAETASGKTYQVALNAEFAPFESMTTDGKVEGFDVDMMDALAKVGGFKVEYKHQPWEGLFATIQNGDADMIISAVTITEDRKQTMDFSDPYYTISQVVLVPNGKNVTSVEDLKKLGKVAVMTGHTGDLVAQKILGATSDKIVRLEAFPLAAKEVESGGVDAVISDSAVVANYVKLNSDKGFTMVRVPDFAEEYYGVAVAKNNPELVNLLNTSLKTIKENGEYQKILDQYFAK
ncbi:basic amino acid ABC transporter substrate-binding protein [Vitreoscilla stercoraria]|uniref:Basic amino acid ABC transporter substrate-binding protein n=1 Tax=Vitreoscilla stercoraria TaxID=61 RepID=A0ABY4EBZ2_VITST|nr:basic amino acid ABC transporter substrate-binding protein [Vitreoscilla stercoraria]UOO92430.1 basic amino acid ABC transporter substrate-binding protein [Vitreoscilla stercoraria]